MCVHACVPSQYVCVHSQCVGGCVHVYTKSVCVCVLVCAKSVCVCQISVYVCGGVGGREKERERKKEGSQGITVDAGQV